MKFIILLLLGSISCFSQNKTGFSVTYGVESRIDFELLDDKIKSNPTQLKYIRKLQRDYASMEYLLKVKNNSSEFNLVNKLYSTMGNPNYAAIAEKNVRYYVDDEVFIEQREAFGEEYLIIAPSNSIEWSISTVQKQILGYDCYKATYTTNDLKIEVWFAPEIPFNFGPKGYHGLPGLILELVQNGKLAYTAQNLIEDSEVWVLKPTTGKEVSREDYESRINEAAKQFKDFNKN